jgi:hypothetical protein
MTRPATIPAGSWPLEMRAETAAAYCDEPSVDAFLAKVQRAIYSAPIRERGCLPKNISSGIRWSLLPENISTIVQVAQLNPLASHPFWLLNLDLAS